MRASVEEAGALLARSDSAGRRRRSPVQSASSPPRPGTLRRQSSSFREDVGHAASETYLVSRLTFTLLQYLGYKAWGALLGRRLAERGIIVACIDYRNFPQGTIGDMVNDASQGISFVCNNIADYGGDPNQYNIHSLVDHFHERGLYRSIFLSIMEGEESLSRYSPEIIAKTSSAETIALLPLIVLMHGTEDYSIPSSASRTFVDVLQQVGAPAKLLLYEGKTHTDIFLQVSYLEL
nr:unnamed protein product [Digitaria exilis]